MVAANPKYARRCTDFYMLQLARILVRDHLISEFQQCRNRVCLSIMAAAEDRNDRCSLDAEIDHERLLLCSPHVFGTGLTLKVTVADSDAMDGAGFGNVFNYRPSGSVQFPKPL